VFQEIEIYNFSIRVVLQSKHEIKPKSGPTPIAADPPVAGGYAARISRSKVLVEKCQFANPADRLINSLGGENRLEKPSVEADDQSRKRT
jgi:hypothetical protein